MHKWFSTETRTPRMSSAARAGLRMAALGAFLLAGFVPMSAHAAPVSVLLHTDLIPVPAEPQGEVHLSYTQTELGAGPIGQIGRAHV